MSIEVKKKMMNINQKKKGMNGIECAACMCDCACMLDNQECCYAGHCLGPTAAYKIAQQKSRRRKKKALSPKMKKWTNQKRYKQIHSLDQCGMSVICVV